MMSQIHVDEYLYSLFTAKCVSAVSKGRISADAFLSTVDSVRHYTEFLHQLNDKIVQELYDIGTEYEEHEEGGEKE